MPDNFEKPEHNNPRKTPYRNPKEKPKNETLQEVWSQADSIEALEAWVEANNRKIKNEKDLEDIANIWWASFFRRAFSIAWKSYRKSSNTHSKDTTEIEKDREDLVGAVQATFWSIVRARESKGKQTGDFGTLQDFFTELKTQTTRRAIFDPRTRAGGGTTGLRLKNISLAKHFESIVRKKNKRITKENEKANQENARPLVTELSPEEHAEARATYLHWVESRLNRKLVPSEIDSLDTGEEISLQVHFELKSTSSDGTGEDEDSGPWDDIFDPRSSAHPDWQGSDGQPGPEDDLVRKEDAAARSRTLRLLASARDIVFEKRKREASQADAAVGGIYYWRVFDAARTFFMLKHFPDDPERRMPPLKEICMQYQLRTEEELRQVRRMIEYFKRDIKSLVVEGAVEID